VEVPEFRYLLLMLPQEEKRMEKTSLGVKFLKASLVYFIIGITIGASYTIKPVHDFIALSPLFAGAHSHISLLGWVSFAVMGAIYSLSTGSLNKSLYSERLGNISFWLLNTGVAAMFILLLLAGYTEASLIRAGNSAMVEAATAPYMILVMVFGGVIAIGAYLFAYNVYKTLSSRTS